MRILPVVSAIASPVSVAVSPQLLLTDKKLIANFIRLGAPLPFGLTRLRQDRLNGCLGGVPHRRLAGKHLYEPGEVSRFLAGLPVIQAKPPKPTQKRNGRPSAGEAADAAKRGLSVREYRAQQNLAGV